MQHVQAFVSYLWKAFLSGALFWVPPFAISRVLGDQPGSSAVVIVAFLALPILICGSVLRKRLFGFTNVSNAWGNALAFIVGIWYFGFWWMELFSKSGPEFCRVCNFEELETYILFAIAGTFSMSFYTLTIFPLVGMTWYAFHWRRSGEIASDADLA